MSFSVRLMRGGNPLFTFATPTPFASVTRKGEFDDLQPPNLVAILSTWTIDGILYGTEATLPADWAALKAKVEDPTTYPDGLDLLRDGAPPTVVETLTGYYGFKIEELEVVPGPRQWRSEVNFRLRISARKLFVYGFIATPNLSSYESTHTWSYDEAGLATETLENTIKVTTGSAVATARLLGGLSPPVGYAFVTNGPEGIDVEQLDRADQNARSTSTIRQNGEALPTGVGPSFSVVKETRVQANGEQVTTVSVTAVGTGAEAAVKAQRPASVFTEAVAVDNKHRTATGNFVTKQIITQKTHRFTLSGGGRGWKWTRRTGGRKPAAHLGSFGEVTIREEFRVETLGDPSTDKFKVPLSLSSVPNAKGDTTVFEDSSGFEMQGPEVLEYGKDRTTTKWGVTFRRLYKATSFADAANAIFKQSLLDSATRGVGSSSLDVEVAKPDQGAL